MKTGVKKYQLLEISVNPPLPMEHFKLWHECLSDLIKKISEDCLLTILRPRPHKYSIGNDIGTVVQTGSFNSIKYMLTSVVRPSLSEVREITNSDEFYLGLIGLLIGDVYETQIQNLLLTWDKEPVKSEVEFLKSDSDGMCFYWYNPKSIEKAIFYLNAFKSSVSSEIKLTS